VTPIVVGPDDALNLSLSCTSPGRATPRSSTPGTWPERRGPQGGRRRAGPGAGRARGSTLPVAAAPSTVASPVGPAEPPTAPLPAPPGRTTLVSQTAGGGFPNNASAEPSISADGRYVAFASAATNVAGAERLRRCRRSTSATACELARSDSPCHQDSRAAGRRASRRSRPMATSSPSPISLHRGWRCPAAS
jgi:hypothetical protein